MFGWIPASAQNFRRKQNEAARKRKEKRELEKVEIEAQESNPTSEIEGLKKLTEKNSYKVEEAASDWQSVARYHDKRIIEAAENGENSNLFYLGISHLNRSALYDLKQYYRDRGFVVVEDHNSFRVKW